MTLEFQRLAILRRGAHIRSLVQAPAEHGRLHTRVTNRLVGRPNRSAFHPDALLSKASRTAYHAVASAWAGPPRGDYGLAFEWWEEAINCCALATQGAALRAAASVAYRNS